MGRPKRKTTALRQKSTQKQPVKKKKRNLTAEMPSQIDEENNQRCTNWLATLEGSKLHDEFPNDSGSQSEAEPPIDIISVSPHMTKSTAS